MTEAATVALPLLAGIHPNGQPVIENIQARPLGDDQFRLLHSPLFVCGAAAGDEIRVSQREPGHFRVVQHSGQLAVRVMCRDGIAALSEQLTPEVELLGGKLDAETPRALVYSIHVGVGFQDIEALFDRMVGPLDDARWQYGNVYDEHGEPLDWWEPLLNP